jgi:putative membrane protein
MIKFIQLLRKSISSLERYQVILLVSWLVVMLSLPLLNVIFGQQALLQGLALAVLLQLAFVLHVLYRAWGWWSMLRAAVGVVLLAWAVQAIVIRSGLPYGNMQYTSLLQPQVMRVPVLIPLTWLMMLPSAWAVAKLITRRLSGCLMRPAFVLVSALAFTAWGFILDPLLVHLDLLRWNPAGEFYGTPWLNYIGWLLVSAVITFGISPKRLPCGSLVLVYDLSWLVEFIAVLIFWGSPIPALIGFCLMGGMLLWAGIITR